MANVLQPHIEFQPRPVAHAPSPVGFRFGFTPSTLGWPLQATNGHTNPQAFQQLASSVTSSPARAQKRRHDSRDDPESATGRDDEMDRSPTPERPKRAAPKRARVAPLDVESRGVNVKEAKSRGDDVDVGVLLARLPPQSLLPILMSLLDAHPALKSSILPLIPRPTLETAIQTLAQAAKKLRDAYPYSNASPAGSSGHSTPLSFGFGQSAAHSSNSNGGMRDAYILSRLRPQIGEFMAAFISYLPYFSYLRSTLPDSGRSGPSSQPENRDERISVALQALHRDQSHPSETFLFLAAVTNHLLSQPSLTQTALAPLLLPHLSDEWKAWIDRVDEVVNRDGGMFGSDTVKVWERGLDEMASNRDYSQVFRPIRDNWVSRVGWLVGRSPQSSMDEL